MYHWGQIVLINLTYRNWHIEFLQKLAHRISIIVKTSDMIRTFSADTKQLRLFETYKLQFIYEVAGTGE